MNPELQPLRPGTAAPDFILPHSPRNRISLNGHLSRPVVLVFYPFDWEPVTSEQLALYQDYLVEFEKHSAFLLGISLDHPWSQAAFARDIRIRFPLLSDTEPRGAVAALYGVYRANEGRSARALFVMDGLGVIRFSQTYPDEINPGVHEILSTLEELQREGNPPEHLLR